MTTMTASNDNPAARAAETLVTYRGVVYPWHCDHMGHMNVMWYVGKFDEATWNLLAAIGLTHASLRDSSCGMAAVEQNIKYKRELMAGDTIFVRSSILEVREKVVKFLHEMLLTEGEHSVATMEVVGVHFDRAARKACPLPATVHARARAMAGISTS